MAPNTKWILWMIACAIPGTLPSIYQAQFATNWQYNIEATCHWAAPYPEMMEILDAMGPARNWFDKGLPVMIKTRVYVTKAYTIASRVFMFGPRESTWVEADAGSLPLKAGIWERHRFDPPLSSTPASFQTTLTLDYKCRPTWAWKTRLFTCQHFIQTPTNCSISCQRMFCPKIPENTPSMIQEPSMFIGNLAVRRDIPLFVYSEAQPIITTLMLNLTAVNLARTLPACRPYLKASWAQWEQLEKKWQPLSHPLFRGKRDTLDTVLSGVGLGSGILNAIDTEVVAGKLGLVGSRTKEVGISIASGLTNVAQGIDIIGHVLPQWVDIEREIIIDIGNSLKSSIYNLSIAIQCTQVQSSLIAFASQLIQASLMKLIHPEVMGMFKKRYPDATQHPTELVKITGAQWSDMILKIGIYHEKIWDPQLIYPASHIGLPLAESNATVLPERLLHWTNGTHLYDLSGCVRNQHWTHCYSGLSGTPMDEVQDHVIIPVRTTSLIQLNHDCFCLRTPCNHVYLLPFECLLDIDRSLGNPCFCQVHIRDCFGMEFYLHETVREYTSEDPYVVNPKLIEGFHLEDEIQTSRWLRLLNNLSQTARRIERTEEQIKLKVNLQAQRIIKITEQIEEVSKNTWLGDWNWSETGKAIMNLLTNPLAIILGVQILTIAGSIAVICWIKKQITELQALRYTLDLPKPIRHQSSL